MLVIVISLVAVVVSRSLQDRHANQYFERRFWLVRNDLHMPTLCGLIWDVAGARSVIM
jgi:hypothetical protein